MSKINTRPEAAAVVISLLLPTHLNASEGSRQTRNVPPRLLLGRDIACQRAVAWSRFTHVALH